LYFGKKKNSLVVELTKHIKSQADSDVESPSDLNAFFPKVFFLFLFFFFKLNQIYFFSLCG